MSWTVTCTEAALPAVVRLSLEEGVPFALVKLDDGLGGGARQTALLPVDRGLPPAGLVVAELQVEVRATGPVLRVLRVCAPDIRYHRPDWDAPLAPEQRLRGHEALVLAAGSKQELSVWLAFDASATTGPPPLRPPDTPILSATRSATWPAPLRNPRPPWLQGRLPSGQLDRLVLSLALGGLLTWLALATLP